VDTTVLVGLIVTGAPLTVDVGAGIERHLHAEDIRGAAV